VIKSFKWADTKTLADGQRVPRFVNIEAVARRKLRQLEVAGPLEDLRVPPGNRLEALKGDRAGQHSIRIKIQYTPHFSQQSDYEQHPRMLTYFPQLHPHA